MCLGRGGKNGVVAGAVVTGLGAGGGGPSSALSFGLTAFSASPPAAEARYSFSSATPERVSERLQRQAAAATRRGGTIAARALPGHRR